MREISLMKSVFFTFLFSIVPLAAMAGTFQLKDVADAAQKSAAQPFQAMTDKIPDFLKNITYDQWRDIRFNNSKSIWANENSPFTVQFFHLGFYYKWPVAVNYVDQTGVHPFVFSPQMFNYGKNDFQAKVPADLGFAGFRIHYPLNKPSYHDEVIVFLGASYFRAVAKNQLYGLSARGLAVNTASSSGEEFPFFKEFWIVKPSPEDKQITLYALLDSPSLTGAYEFIIRPGEKTIIRVKSVLFVRKKIDKIGISPMTSMFLFGKNSRLEKGQHDFRPEVHDSDGLSILTKQGEWIWRPLVNPHELLVNSFEVGTPQGFGLLQRDLNFDHYQDLEARFDLRPSLWVRPEEDWGKGHVELIEIPSDSEYNDNINAFWVPDQPPQAGDTLHFSYTLQWCSALSKMPPKGFVAATRIARGSDKTKFIIDFQGRQINAIGGNGKVEADINVSKGYKILEEQTFKNTVTGGWRVVFQVASESQDPLKDVIPDKKRAADLRVFLKEGEHALTETWTYTFI